MLGSGDKCSTEKGNKGERRGKEKKGQKKIVELKNKSFVNKQWKRG